MKFTKNTLQENTHSFKRFLAILWQHINHDRLTTSAASLAYTSILALVPLITVIFSLLSAFPILMKQVSHYGN